MFFYKKKTAYEMRISDGSSDVCSSDLIGAARALAKCVTDRFMLYYMNKSPHCRGKQRMIAFHNLSEGGDEHDRSCQNAVAPVGGGDRVAALEGLWRDRLCDDQPQESRIYGGVHARDAESLEERRLVNECDSRCRCRWWLDH